MTTVARIAVHVVRASWGAAACTVVLGLFASAGAQRVDERLWGVNPSGTVTAVVPVGRTLYVGGAFRDVGPNSGGGVPFDLLRGRPPSRYAKVAGFVDAAVSDGRGGWFVGGVFQGAGGRRRINLAHVLPGGEVAELATEADDWVMALAFDGRTLYVGGMFHSIGDSARSGLAAIDAVSGHVLPWNPGVNGFVAALADNDSVIFVGGSFSTIGGQARSNLAAVRKQDGSVTGWAPDANNTVWALLSSGPTLYVGGDFWQIAGEVRLAAGAVDVVSGTATAWNPTPRPSGDPPRPQAVYALALGRNSVYVGGYFATIGGAARDGVAEVDPVLGLASDWNPNAAGGSSSYAPTVRAVCVGAGAVYVGGDFRDFAGSGRNYCVAVDACSGRLTEWDPRVNEAVTALAADAWSVYVGGGFGSVGGWTSRKGLAALDARTGAALPWDPQFVGVYVQAMAAGPRLLYFSGAFRSVGGQPRDGLAAVDLVTGQVAVWNPMPDGFIHSILATESAVYVGGSFYHVGGQLRANVAALDPVSGAALPWNPWAIGSVRALLLRDTTLLLGGSFRTVGGQDRNTLAAVSTRSGQVLDWRSDGNGTVLSLSAGDSTLFVAGGFDTLGGAPRNNLAEVELNSGRATGWAPNPDRPVKAMVSSNGIVVIGGEFENVGAFRQPHLAAISASSGELLEWPSADGYVWDLAASAQTVYVGGSMSACGAIPTAGLAGVSAPDGWRAPPSSPDTNRVVLLQNAPNPVIGSALIRFRLPRAGQVSLTVYDLQGRVQARLIDEAVLPAGVHGVSASVGSWPAGCCLYRLEVGGEGVSRKMLVLR